MPISDSCIVVLSLSIFLAASASIAIITDGFICFAIPLIISAVSIPVSPITPGIIEHTHSPVSSLSICPLIYRFFATSGPSESDVISLLPSPATKRLMCLLELIFFPPGNGILLSCLLFFPLSLTFLFFNSSPISSLI